MLLQFIKDHGQAIGGFCALLFISFVNAMPDKWEDWSTYQVTHQTLLGIIPISKRLPPPAPSPTTPPGTVAVK